MSLDNEMDKWITGNGDGNYGTPRELPEQPRCEGCNQPFDTQEELDEHLAKKPIYATTGTHMTLREWETYYMGGEVGDVESYTVPCNECGEPMVVNHPYFIGPCAKCVAKHQPKTYEVDEDIPF